MGASHLQKPGRRGLWACHIIATCSNCQEGKYLTLGMQKLGRLKGRLPQERGKRAGIWRVSRINQAKRAGEMEGTACTKVLTWREWREPRPWTLELWGGKELVHDESRQFSGPCGPHECSALFPSSSGKPCKDFKYREWDNSIKLWPEQQEEISPWHEVGAHWNPNQEGAERASVTSGFQPHYAKHKAFQGRGELWKKSTNLVF